jgi:hypothetical protein
MEALVQRPRFREPVGASRLTPSQPPSAKTARGPRPEKRTLQEGVQEEIARRLLKSTPHFLHETGRCHPRSSVCLCADGRESSTAAKRLPRKFGLRPSASLSIFFLVRRGTVPVDKPTQPRRGAPVGAAAGPKGSFRCAVTCAGESGEKDSQGRLKLRNLVVLRRRETSQEADGSLRRTVNVSGTVKL